MKSKKYPTAPEPLVTLQHAMFQAVAQFYLFAYYINIPEKTFQRMDVFHSDIYNETHTGRYEEEREWFVTRIVDPAFQAQMRAFTDLHTLEARIHDEIIYQDYRNCNDRTYGKDDLCRRFDRRAGTFCT